MGSILSQTIRRRLHGHSPGAIHTTSKNFRTKSHQQAVEQHLTVNGRFQLYDRLLQVQQRMHNVDPNWMPHRTKLNLQLLAAKQKYQRQLSTLRMLSAAAKQNNKKTNNNNATEKRNGTKSKQTISKISINANQSIADNKPGTRKHHTHKLNSRVLTASQQREVDLITAELHAAHKNTEDSKPLAATDHATNPHRNWDNVTASTIQPPSTGSNSPSAWITQPTEDDNKLPPVDSSSDETHGSSESPINPNICPLAGCDTPGLMPTPDFRLLCCCWDHHRAAFQHFSNEKVAMTD